MGRVFKSILKKKPQLLQASAESNAEFLDRRRFIRMKKLIGVMVQHGITQHKASIVDMGVGGFRIETRAQFEVDDRLKISPLLETPGYSAEGIECRVAWVTPLDSGRQILGVALEDAEEVLKRSWINYVLHYAGFTNKTFKQRRKHRRIQTRLKAEAATGERMIHGAIVDICLNGAAFETSEELPKGLLVLLSIGPYREFKMLHIHGRILNGRLDPRDHHRFIFGMQFVNPALEEKKLLKEYLRSLFKDSNKPLRSEAPQARSSWGQGDEGELPEPGFHD